jgi:RHS repeat-associated protein
VAAGAYTLTARATDNQNGTTTSAPVGITVNQVAALYFIHSDHLNTPRLITNQVGQAVWQWDNADPFGNNAPNENPSGLGTFTCNLRLPGQYFDQETNTHYNYFRDYDPATGRYPQSDSIGLSGGINTYAYVQNNPLSNFDPLGLEVYIMGKPAVAPVVAGSQDPTGYHLYLQLVPNYPAAFSNLNGWSAQSNGQISATLGGQPFGAGFNLPYGNLRSAPNNDPSNAPFRQRVDPPCGMSDTQFINLIIQASASYKNDLPYRPLPSGQSFNSNGYVAGVLRAAGVVPPQLNTSGAFQAPGYNKPIPLTPLYSPMCCR